MELRVTYNSCYTTEELIEEHGESCVEWIKEIKYLVQDYIERFNITTTNRHDVYINGSQKHISSRL